MPEQRNPSNEYEWLTNRLNSALADIDRCNEAERSGVAGSVWSDYAFYQQSTRDELRTEFSNLRHAVEKINERFAGDPEARYEAIRWHLASRIETLDAEIRLAGDASDPKGRATAEYSPNARQLVLDHMKSIGPIFGLAHDHFTKEPGYTVDEQQLRQERFEGKLPEKISGQAALERVEEIAKEQQKALNQLQNELDLKR